MPIRGLKTFILHNPVSITKKIPSTVSEVSAILVATMHLRVPLSALWNILAEEMIWQVSERR